MSLDGCLIAVTIWNFYAAFIAVVGYDDNNVSLTKYSPVLLVSMAAFQKNDSWKTSWNHSHSFGSLILPFQCGISIPIIDSIRRRANFWENVDLKWWGLRKPGSADFWWVSKPLLCLMSGCLSFWTRYFRLVRFNFSEICLIWTACHSHFLFLVSLSEWADSPQAGRSRKTYSMWISKSTNSNALDIGDTKST